MKTDIFIEPETGAEVEFLDRLGEAREMALAAGIDEAEVAAVFGQFAAGMYIESVSESAESDESRLSCPSCGTVVEDIESPGIGSEPVVRPCGCTVAYEELPPGAYLDDGD